MKTAGNMIFLLLSWFIEAVTHERKVQRSGTMMSDGKKKLSLSNTASFHRAYFKIFSFYFHSEKKLEAVLMRGL